MNQPPDNPYNTSPYAPPPPQKPMPHQRALSWYRHQSRPMQVIVALVIIGAVIFVGSAVVSGAVQGVQQGIATPTAATQGSQPTSAAQPTQKPTQVPPTATPTQTVKQRIAQIVHDKASSFSKIDMTQNDGKTVVAQITLNEALDKNAARLMIQENCFDIEQALWTAHIASLQDVDLAFRGPAVDKFGNNSTAPYGVCDLTKATAAQFNWGNLSPPTAWDAYDNAMFYTIIQG